MGQYALDNSICSSYLDRHNNSGLKVGDYVKIIREPKSGEHGWGLEWPNSISSWDAISEKILYIMEDRGRKGFGLGYDLDNNQTVSLCTVPYFLLERVKIQKEEETYLEKHKNSGFKVGDIVWMTTARYEEYIDSDGWEGEWPWDDFRDRPLGRDLTIVEDYNEKGFGVYYNNGAGDNNVKLPYSVLKKVENKGDDNFERLNKLINYDSHEDVPNSEESVDNSNNDEVDHIANNGPSHEIDNNKKEGMRIMGKIKLLVLSLIGLISFFILLKTTKNIMKNLDNKNIYNKYIDILKDKYKYIKSKIKDIMEVK